MRDLERSLLSAALLDDAVSELISLGLKPEMLEDPEHRQVCVWAYEFLSTYGTSPGEDALRLQYPTWRYADGDLEPLAFYWSALKERARHNSFAETVAGVQALLDKRDVEGIKQAMAEAVLYDGTEFSTSTDEDITVAFDDRVEHYNDLRRNPGHLRGISTGFRTIDIATMGIQPSQFIVIGGAQKAGKTTCLMKMGTTINVAGYSILMISFEMSAIQMTALHDAVRAGVSNRKLLTGYTTAGEMRKVRRALDRAAGGYPFHLVTDIAQNTTVSAVAAKIEQYKPDVVLLDGVYLMDDEFGEPPGSSAAITNITRGIHRLCLATKVPIVGTTQALESKMSARGGITTHSLGYASSWGQDADVVLGLQQVPDTPNEAELRVMDSRVGPKAVSKLVWDWDTMTFAEVESGWEADHGPNDVADKRTASF